MCNDVKMIVAQLLLLIILYGAVADRLPVPILGAGGVLSPHVVGTSALAASSSPSVHDVNDTRSAPSSIEVEQRYFDLKRYRDATNSYLEETYKGKVMLCQIPDYPLCDVYVCGTLHVSKTSADMVKDTIRKVAPDYIILELCDGRIDSICDASLDEEMLKNMTLRSIFKHSYQERSFLTFGTSLLSWMQLKASKAMGNKLGQELYVAAKEGYEQQSSVILGDRLYSVTVQRCFDQLKFFEKVKVVFTLLYEVLSMTVRSIKEYIAKTENDNDFMKKELEKFERMLPSLARIIIRERDEYIAQIVCDVARSGFGNDKYRDASTDYRGKIVVVVGAAHMPGIKSWLLKNGSTEDRLKEISMSSKQLTPTWPGRNRFAFVNVNSIFQPSPK